MGGKHGHEMHMILPALVLLKKYSFNFWQRWVFVVVCGLLFAAVHQLLIAVASLVAEHRL